MEPYCPITLIKIQDLKNPVVGTDGHTYEKDAIVSWLQKKRISPVTNAPMQITDLIDLYTFRNTTENSNKLKNQKEKVFFITLDISGSMSTHAQTPDKEIHGYTLLDIAKFGILSFAKSLDPVDKLCLITFSNNAIIELPLTNMNNTGIKTLSNKLQKINTRGGTNLWDGIFVSFNNASEYKHSNIIFFTDGIPTIIPPRGHTNMLEKLITKIKKENKYIPILRTIGFGEQINSLLLTNLSKLANGSFSYVPDVNFIGTVIQHILANTKIQINYSESPLEKSLRTQFYKTLSKIIDILSINDNNGNISGYYSSYNQNLTSLDDILKATVEWDNYINDSQTPNIYKEPQVKIAIQQQYCDTWGKHYLRSLETAHRLLECNNFKDESVQNYGTKRGDKWIELLNHADNVFISMPPPKRTTSIQNLNNNSQSPPTTMRSYSNSNAPCFHENSKILVCDDKNKICIQKKCSDIQPGDSVFSPLSNTWEKIDYILKTKILSGNCQFAYVGTLLVTPWHPLYHEESKKWVYAGTLGIPVNKDCNYVYSFSLESRASSIQIDDQIAITLAHNLNSEIAKHNFWGTEAIINEMKKIDKNNKICIIQQNQIIRENNNAIKFYI